MTAFKVGRYGCMETDSNQYNCSCKENFHADIKDGGESTLRVHQLYHFDRGPTDVTSSVLAAPVVADVAQFNVVLPWLSNKQLSLQEILSQCLCH